MKTKHTKKEARVVLAREESAAVPATNGPTREYAKDGSACTVMFWLPREAAPDAKCVALVGTFNRWDENAHRMSRLESGDFALAVELEAGKEYEFRYLIDGTRWENSWSADKYVWSEYAGCENSVIVT